MPSELPINPPASSAGVTSRPNLPLTPELRAAYENLYNQYEVAIENTIDPGVLEALSASQKTVEDTLSLDNMYRLKAITAQYNALLQQIESTNEKLKALQTQILAISSGISTFGDILGAISKVLSLLPGA
jgi:archaellum component FlaC